MISNTYAVQRPIPRSGEPSPDVKFPLTNGSCLMQNLKPAACQFILCCCHTDNYVIIEHNLAHDLTYLFFKCT
jgi:hypothetical protein